MCVSQFIHPFSFMDTEQLASHIMQLSNGVFTIMHFSSPASSRVVVAHCLPACLPRNALSVFLCCAAAAAAAAPKCILLPVPFCSDSERVKVLSGEKEPEREREREGDGRMKKRPRRRRWLR